METWLIVEGRLAIERGDEERARQILIVLRGLRRDRLQRAEELRAARRARAYVLPSAAELTA